MRGKPYLAFTATQSAVRAAAVRNQWLFCVGTHTRWCPRCWAVCQLAAAPRVCLAAACVPNCPSVFVYGMCVELSSVWCVGEGAVDDACSGEVNNANLETQVFSTTGSSSGLLYMRRN